MYRNLEMDPNYYRAMEEMENCPYSMDPRLMYEDNFRSYMDPYMMEDDQEEFFQMDENEDEFAPDEMYRQYGPYGYPGRRRRRRHGRRRRFPYYFNPYFFSFWF
jgi:hypothetical protein